ncbi:hypothetical protein JD844_022879 [Phrynosoma platyrhinos]|uniref:G protein-coupled receptor 155 n=1 Tax=Phrynosoma platyrhinos TaxID=52577 RepID=A0ABQ7SW82_PHRPL|nr:hypothetical protein JD844_022879 [Phrynosoma platyrhinos]
MVVLNFSNVNWSFLYSILVAKASVFFLVCVLTFLIVTPERRFSKAGLFPIFATQSNDFALGYPIVEALYQTTYPEYLQYIYLVAPISLMMLNPLGFIFCEIQKSRDNRSLSHSKIKIVGLGLLRVLQNPIVFMVFIGIASNFILNQKIPEYLENFLDGLASSFSGSALFYLGLTMVGQIKKLTRSTFVALILLITAKLLLMPLLCREMVELLDKSDSLVNHTSLSNYAFLYGVFPSAPGVAIFATQFNMEVEVVCLLSFSLLLLKRREALKIPVGFIIIAGWGIPAVLVGILLIAGKHTDDIDSAFFYGNYQMITTAVVVSISILISGISLMCMNRSGVEANYEALNQQSQHRETEEPEREVSEQSRSSTSASQSVIDSSIERGRSAACAKRRIEGYAVLKERQHVVLMPMITALYQLRQVRFLKRTVHWILLLCFLANQCLSPCNSERCVLVQEEQLLQTGDKQLARHVLLCLLLIVGLFAVSISFGEWDGQ